MRIQIEVSIYPLKVKSLSEPVDTFTRILKKTGLDVHTRSMSTLAVGDSQVLFRALEEACGKLAEECDVVMDAKISNACPLGEKESNQ